MQTMVENIHAIMWEFCEIYSLDVDPVSLKRSIRQHVYGALEVVSPTCLERIGAQKLAVMINTAGTFDVTLAEIFTESLMESSDKSATLCQVVKSRKTSTLRITGKPYLSLVK